MTAAVHYLQGRLALRVVLVFAAAYVLSYALRAINAVIAPELMADLRLNNADLGLLSSAYFFGFGAMQLPIGIWLDRYGSRRTEAALLMFAAIRQDDTPTPIRARPTHRPVSDALDANTAAPSAPNSSSAASVRREP